MRAPLPPQQLEKCPALPLPGVALPAVPEVSRNWPQPPAPLSSLPQICSYFAYGDQGTLSALQAALVQVDPGLVLLCSWSGEWGEGGGLSESCGASALVPGARCCLALAFSTDFLQGCSHARPDAACPADFLLKANRGPTLKISPAHIMRLTKPHLAEALRFLGLKEAAPVGSGVWQLEGRGGERGQAALLLLPAHNEDTFAVASQWAALNWGGLAAMGDSLVTHMRAYHGDDVGGYFLFFSFYQSFLFCFCLLFFALSYLTPGASTGSGRGAADAQAGAAMWGLSALASPPRLSTAYAFLFPLGLCVALKVWSWRQSAARERWCLQHAPAPPAHLEEPWTVWEGLRSLLAAALASSYAYASYLVHLQCEVLGRSLGETLPWWRALCQQTGNALWLVSAIVLRDVAAEPMALYLAGLVVSNRDAKPHTFKLLKLRFELLLCAIIVHAPLIYEAFVTRDVKDVRNVLTSLLLLGPFVVTPLLEVLKPLAQPALMRLWRQACRQRAKQQQSQQQQAGVVQGGHQPSQAAPSSASGTLHALQRTANEAPDLPAFDSDADHKRLFLQLSLIACWGAVFPLGALCCLLSNVVELVVDRSVLRRQRRCVDELSGKGVLEGEARWASAFKGLAYLACIASGALLLAGQAGEHLSLQDTLLVFALEHAAFAVMAGIELALPDRLQ